MSELPRRDLDLVHVTERHQIGRGDRRGRAQPADGKVPAHDAPDAAMELEAPRERKDRAPQVVSPEGRHHVGHLIDVKVFLVRKIKALDPQVPVILGRVDEVYAVGQRHTADDAVLVIDVGAERADAKR
jgi:hypothetical protein